ncbi:calmodulin-like protein 30 [Curcuma longa]|uniref:calmodulin-like protein 30 n=1 Tax=Curcuma longa TaxID=136217 RepID=UPI003D9EE304
MSKLRVLDFQYNLDKRLRAFKWRRSSLRDSQVSDLFVRYEPNEVEMRKVFDKISNGKDKIDKGDLERLVKRTHTCHLQSDEKRKVCEAEKEAERMLWAADLNKDGVVDFGEFMEVNRKGGGVRSSEIKSAFWMFDRDGDGRISAADIQKMMERLGESCNLDECERMVKHVDKNQDGVVDMDEFMEMMTSTMKLM